MTELGKFASSAQLLSNRSEFREISSVNDLREILPSNWFARNDPFVPHTVASKNIITRINTFCIYLSE